MASLNSDLHRLHGTKCDICKELSTGRGCQVKTGAKLVGLLLQNEEVDTNRIITYLKHDFQEVEELYEEAETNSIHVTCILLGDDLTSPRRLE